MIKAIIFDCYGVLVGSGFWHTYAAAGGDAKNDAEFIQETLGLLNCGAISSQEFASRVAKQLDIDIDEWIRINNSEEYPNVQLLEYIEKELKPKYKIGLISNAASGSIERRLSVEQLSLFDAIVISADTGMLKPDREIYLYAAEKLSVEPSECAFIDDHQVYVQGAEATGMHGITFSSYDDLRQQLEKLL